MYIYMHTYIYILMFVQYYNNTLFLIRRLVSRNHGHMLFDVVLPVIWALYMFHQKQLAEETTHTYQKYTYNKKNVLFNLSNIITNDFRIVLMDSDPPDDMDDRISLVTPLHSPVYTNKIPFGNLCEPGVWCVYQTVYGNI